MKTVQLKVKWNDPALGVITDLFLPVVVPMFNVRRRLKSQWPPSEDQSASGRVEVTANNTADGLQSAFSCWTCI